MNNKRLVYSLICLGLLALSGCGKHQDSINTVNNTNITGGINMENERKSYENHSEILKELGSQKSYAKIAEDLNQLGIGGMTEQTINQLEKQSEQLPSEVLINKTAALLTIVGRGDINWATEEWTPSKNGVYSFGSEVEAFRIDTMYSHFLLGISALGGEELAFENIKEDTNAVNWAEGTGKRSVSFDWNGNTYTLEAEVTDDWFDFNVVNALNEIIIKNKTGKRLYFTSDDYQEIIVFYRDEDWAKEFRNKTDLPLFESIS